MGLVKTRRLAAMQKQQRAKAGMKPPMKKGAWALPPHLHKFGGKPAADLPRQTVFNVLQNIKTTEYTECTEGRCTTLGSSRNILQ